VWIKHYSEKLMENYLDINVKNVIVFG